MSDYENAPEGAWDEYEWEKFLQKQDQRTEKYMDLLEKYLDDPRRDQIIAREMGWGDSTEEKDWSEELEALMDEGVDAAASESEFTSEGTFDASESFEDHALYRAAFALTIWMDQLFDDNGSLQNSPAAVKLATHSALASAKLAAALSEHGSEEIGMTIAYLKRALKAITVSMDAAAQLLSDDLIKPRQHAVLQQRIFQVRDGIITLMGEYRGEWRRRFGQGE